MTERQMQSTSSLQAGPADNIKINLSGKVQRINVGLQIPFKKTAVAQD